MWSLGISTHRINLSRDWWALGTVATRLDKYKAAELSLLSDLHLFQLYIHALHCVAIS